jgi:hypothetical protein
VLGILLSMFGHFRNRELVRPEGWDEEPGAASGAATPAHRATSGAEADEPVGVAEATPVG